MKVAIIGLGYVGTVTAAVLASQGNQVIGVDIDKNKVECLRERKLKIYEPGLSGLIETNDKLIFSSSYSDLYNVDLAIITVPTPNNGQKTDLSYVFSSVNSLKNVNPTAIVVVKSTVLPGTATRIMKQTGMTVISNPEFTSEGSAVRDTLAPDRVIIGGRNMQAMEKVRELWDFTNSEFVLTNNENAELIKYASNAFLATKISYINEIANLCEKIPGADVTIVAKGMGLDKRIGDKFLNAGLGYGGSCFPKDTLAIVNYALSRGTKLNLIKAAIKVNSDRINHAIGIIKGCLSGTLDGKRISVLGVSFKENTNDIRESQSIKLIEGLRSFGVQVKAFDPTLDRDLDSFIFCKSIEECLVQVDAVVIATEWPMFAKSVSKEISVPLIDLRRILNPEDFSLFTAIGRNNV